MVDPIPRDKILTVSLMTEFDADLIKTTLDQLQVDTVELYIKSQAPIDGLAYDCEEQYFKVKYGVQPLSTDFLEVRCLAPVSTSAQLRSGLARRLPLSRLNNTRPSIRSSQRGLRRPSPPRTRCARYSHLDSADPASSPFCCRTTARRSYGTSATVSRPFSQ
jgi:hypothetical protein